MGERDTAAVQFQLDPNLSRFLVRAFATGMFASFGHNPTLAIRGFSGEGQYVPETMEAASLRVSVKAAGLTVVGDVSEKDRLEIERIMHRDVLETAHYPDILFESRNIAATRIGGAQYRAVIDGELSLHGVTRPHRLEAQVLVSGDTLRANGEFELRQTDYQIRPVNVAGGALKVKDELKLSFDIVARAVVK